MKHNKIKIQDKTKCNKTRAQIIMKFIEIKMISQISNILNKMNMTIIKKKQMISITIIKKSIIMKPIFKMNFLSKYMTIMAK